MNSSWTTRPIFISSTFRDMQAERDHLRDVVFPEVQQTLRARQCHLEFVDLRWGVETVDTPEQQAKELLVLKVCLKEIDRSRPFLLVILGDRYGWIPPPERMQSAANEEGMGAIPAGSSVTALEIHHGVLASPEQAARSLFYFRDIENFNDIPVELRGRYHDKFSGQASSAESHRRLELLKKEIEANPELSSRVRRYPVRWERDRFVGIVEWGKIVKEDLLRELEDEVKENIVYKDTSWQGQERRAAEEFVELHSRSFVGRDNLNTCLRNHALSRSGEKWCSCVLGGSGSGKSAVFAATARRLQRWQKRGTCLLLMNVAGISPRSTSVESMLSRWTQELSLFLGVAFDEEYLDALPVAARCERFAELLTKASLQRRVVVMVDALDQFDNTAMARQMAWLPRAWPANTRFLATSTPGAASNALREHHGADIRELSGLGKSEAMDLITALCSTYHKTLNSRVLEALIGPGSDSMPSPLWLNIATEHLLLLDEDDFLKAEEGSGDGDERIVNTMLSVAHGLPRTIEELYQSLFLRADEHFGRRNGISWIPDLLEMLACTRYGLREQDIRTLMKQRIASRGEATNDKKVTEEFDLQFAAVRRYLRAHLVPRRAEGYVQFNHRKGLEGAFSWRFKDAFQLYRKSQQEIVTYLESLQVDDGLRSREAMWHFIQADDKSGAARYLGGEIPDFNSMCAVALMAEALLYNAQSKKHLEWILSLSDQPFLTVEQKAMIFHHINKTYDAIQDSSPIDIKKAILPRIVLHFERQLAEGATFEIGDQLHVAYDRAGELLTVIGELDGALKLLQKARRSHLSMAGALPLNETQRANEAIAVALLSMKIADIYRQCSSFELAAANYSDAYHAIEPARNSRFHPVYVKTKAAILLKTGQLLGMIGPIEEARRRVQECLNMCAPVRADASFPVFLALEMRDTETIALIQAGDLWLNYDCVKALEFYEEAIVAREKLVAEFPENDVYREHLSTCCERMSTVLQRTGRLEGALCWIERALSEDRLLAGKDPQSVKKGRSLALTLNKKADVLVDLGKEDDALGLYREALTIRTRIAAEAPQIPIRHRDVMTSHERIAGLYSKQGNHTQANQELDGAFVAASEFRKETNDSPDSRLCTAVVLVKRYDALSKLHDTVNADTAIRSAVSLVRQLRMEQPENPEFMKAWEQVVRRGGG